MRTRKLAGVILFLEISGVAAYLQVVRAQTNATAAPNATDTPTPQWEIDAGGKMAFDVVSVKRHPYDPAARAYYPHSNFPLDGSDSYKPTGGLLSTEDMPVATYISFAYKLTADEASHITYPKWAMNEHFDLEARGAANATKGQMRLMMRSLLADRFKLAVHWEDQQVQVFKAVLAKEGKLGPNLEPYSGNPCPEGTEPPQQNAKFPFEPMCGRPGMRELPDREFQVVGRSIPIQQLVVTLRRWAGTGIDRPLVDGTALTGDYDYVLTFVPDVPGVPQQTVAQGPTYLEALKDQLGLKLEPAEATLPFLILDHIEEPNAD
ncbi:MAG TPA: TIGR03435 family protein [Candidatus Acidoferrales bacterium]